MNIQQLLTKRSRRSKRENKDILQLRNEIDRLRTYIDMPHLLVDSYYQAIEKDEYWRVFDKNEPKVSICIATYNRAQLLIDRSIQSALAQSYPNIEVIVIGDHCTDNTEQLVSQINDPRLRFVNLPERGKYPNNPHLRWMVAGSTPMNMALDMATGDFITHLDDDDEHIQNRVELLIKEAKQSRAEFLWHPFWYEKEIDDWAIKEAKSFNLGQVTTSSVFYHHWFKCIKWDINAWRLGEPGDWNRFRKFKYLNIKSHRVDVPLLRHYKERNQSNA